MSTARMSIMSSYKSIAIHNILYVVGWFLSVSDFFWSFFTKLRHNIICIIFDDKISSLYVIHKNEKVYEIWNWEKDNILSLVYAYLKYDYSRLYHPSVEIPPLPQNIYAITTYKNGEKIYHISSNLEKMYLQNHNIVYAILDDVDITPLVKGLHTEIPVTMIKEIAQKMFLIKKNIEPVLKIMKDNTFVEHLFKGTEEISI